MKKLLLLTVVVLGTLLAALVYVGSDEIKIAFSQNKLQNKQTITINEGSSLRAIAAKLKTVGVLKSPLLFEAYVRLQNKMNMLKPGEYVFNVPSSIHQIVNKLEKGQVKLRSLTIPEGSVIKDIVRYAEKAGICSSGSLLEKLKDKQFQLSLNIPGPSFEGFLYPETYKFAKNTPAETVVKTLVAEFFRRVTLTDIDKAQAKGFDLLKWVTLASIIERESSNPKEHRIIASVFHNRLKKGMKLQSDPTVIYGIENYAGNITKKHLLTPTPYNTYTGKGLPPGPISSPSYSALMAVLDPLETEFIYFVATKQGGHYFSKTYDEHLAAVRKFQLK